MEEYYLLTFSSTHCAIAADNILKQLGCTIMPVPRFISASCGISIRIKPEQREQAEAEFKAKSKLAETEYSYYHIKSDKAKGEIFCEPAEMLQAI
ncbi:MAG: DUF3343 domain-containing protein [Clostridiales bacterium]|nr:DUF3343 domain-containing protein [Candidatus Crickella caballi]